VLAIVAITPFQRALEYLNIDWNPLYFTSNNNEQNNNNKIMSDPYAADDQDRQFLWICFLSLFIVLFSCSLVVLLSRVCCFCERYCICQWKWCGCCCVVDVEAYRRERQHLHRLRELRQQRDVEIAHLATFTQIPGPIPDSYGFRELRRQTAIRDLTSLGFIVVTPQGAHSSASQNDVNSLEMRNHLSTEQRRDILDRLLSCRVRLSMKMHECVM
jgi:hypothetical protein